MRSTRLLAQIRFAQAQDEAAIILIKSAIEQGESLKQYSDLTWFYGILDDYYTRKGDFEQAHASLLKRFQVTELANQAMNHSRILQFKARLNEQDIQPETTGSIHAPSLFQKLDLEWAYSTFFLVIMAILGGAIWDFIDKQNNRPPSLTLGEQRLSPLEQLKMTLHSAKQGNYPLTLLLLNACQIRLVDMSPLQDELLHKLRQQDKLIRYSIDEIVILLPHTSTMDAQRVVNQLTATIQRWQGASRVNIGIAALQQFDTLESLIKRASINQLGKLKVEETSQHHYSPAK